MSDTKHTHVEDIGSGARTLSCSCGFDATDAVRNLLAENALLREALEAALFFCRWDYQGRASHGNVFRPLPDDNPRRKGSWARPVGPLRRMARGSKGGPQSCLPLRPSRSQGSSGS